MIVDAIDWMPVRLVLSSGCVVRWLVSMLVKTGWQAI
jgi:hypothetical protein